MKRVKSPLDTFFREEKEGGVERLIMLSDGIFAIAMTLLVLDIKLPDDLIKIEETCNKHLCVDPGTFHQALLGLFWLTVFYGLTFFVIANYWRANRRLMHLIERVDSRFISLSLLFLGLIALFPAAMSLQSVFGGHPEATMIYILVLASCGFSMQTLWVYALWNCTDGQYRDRPNMPYLQINLSTHFSHLYLSDVAALLCAGSLDHSIPCFYRMASSSIFRKACQVSI